MFVFYQEKSDLFPTWIIFFPMNIVQISFYDFEAMMDNGGRLIYLKTTLKNAKFAKSHFHDAIARRD